MPGKLRLMRRRRRRSPEKAAAAAVPLPPSKSLHPTTIPEESATAMAMAIPLAASARVKALPLVVGTFHPVEDGMGSVDVIIEKETDHAKNRRRSGGGGCYSKFNAAFSSRNLPLFSNLHRDESSTPSTASESEWEELTNHGSGVGGSQGDYPQLQRQQHRRSVPPPPPPHVTHTVVTVPVPAGPSSDIDSRHHHHHAHHHRIKLPGSFREGLQKVASITSLGSHDDDDVVVVDPMDWGFPGFLTREEKGVLEAFRDEVSSRPPEFRAAIFSFGEEEPEDYALCRWLRARKFKLDEVVSMIEQAVELRVEPAKHDFYPDGSVALGVDSSIYKSQYPQIYYSQAKNGAVLLINKPGVLNMTGMECITTMDQINRYQWHAVIHGFGGKIRDIARDDPNCKRFQSLLVMDLKGLSSDSINRRVMDMLQRKSHVDGLCFPETLNRLIIVNAPSYFSLTWRVIKRMLDPRTAAKIEIYSGRHSWEKRMQELVDLDKLPGDYGGTGESTDEAIARANNGGKCGKGRALVRRVTEVMSVRTSAHSTVVELAAGERMDVDIYTRSVEETAFEVERYRGSSMSDDPVSVRFDGAEEGSLHVTIASGLLGPGKFRVVAHSSRSRVSTAENYLMVGNISKV